MGCGCGKKRKIVGNSGSKASSAGRPKASPRSPIGVAKRKRAIAQKSRYAGAKKTRLKK